MTKQAAKTELTLFKALRIERRPLALLAALALVFNMLLAGIAQTAHSAALLKPDWPFGVATLCSADGDGLAPDRGHSGGDGQCPCAALCLSSACCGSPAAMPEAVGIRALEAGQAEFPFPDNGFAESGVFSGLAFARAPPSF